MTRRKGTTKAKSMSVRTELQAKVGGGIAKIMGTKSPVLAEQLLNQVLLTLWVPSDLTKEGSFRQLECVVAMLGGIKPQDEVEAMLATQMIATHNSAMECLRRAVISNQTIEGRDMNLKHAEKLLSIFAKLLETLNRHRGKGQQKVTVEHVHVQSGGQAIVGHIEHKPK